MWSAACVKSPEPGLALFGRSRLFRPVGRQGLSRVCNDLRFRHGGRVDGFLPDDPRIDVWMMLFQPFAQDRRCVALAGAVRKNHDAVSLAQRLGDLVVEGQVFRRALAMFAQFVAMVQVMQEMMRI